MDKNVIEFLIKAKKATYAGKGGKIDSTRPNSRDLQYSEGKLKYIDTYLGGSKFAGEEALWENNVPFWSMNYIGRVIGDNFSGDFLKEALLNVPEEYPFRGPSEYKNGDYTYHCKINGNFNWFNGTEEIYFKNTKIYECIFHGGEIVHNEEGE
ncbi:MAG: DUF5680 domain-containing protein [Oscillospiraceae bacterium]|nr:DUF5680 domain-containing protein [Oscillospiraceae bacterium]